MKNIETIRKIINKNRAFLEQNYKIKNIGVFGSYARKSHQRDSDVDILVEFSETLDIFEFIRLEEFLTNLLGIKVDLVSKKALKPLIKNEILGEVVYI